MNKHQVSPEVITKIRESLLSQNRGSGNFWKNQQDRISKLSDDDLLLEAVEELQRLYELYYND